MTSSWVKLTSFYISIKSLFIIYLIFKKKECHCEMRDESWHFLSTFLENLAIEVLFNADFNGVVQIVDFRHAITIKNYNLSFCTCLDKYISFLAFSITFWGFWPIEHLPPIRTQLGQSYGFACFEGLLLTLINQIERYWIMAGWIFLLPTLK